MTELIEKHYSIDPGKGKKMDGCPYSVFEDGHDVKEFIIPPKGFVFVGFHFDPDARNQIYDGKLTAEYAKISFTQRFKDNLWKFVMAFVIIAVITLIAVLAAGVFKKSDSNSVPKPPKAVVQPKDSISEHGKVATIDETLPLNTPSDSQVPKKDVVVNSDKTEDLEQGIPQPVTDGPNAQFKQEFWALVHQCNFSMDSYHELYINYKGKVEGEEYDYLKFTILKDYVSFKAWYDHLKKIPENQLQSIKSVDELKKRINQ